ncbi:MAG: hypothetical protein AAFX00_11510 [Pseudomonadota bacterium]
MRRLALLMMLMPSSALAQSAEDDCAVLGLGTSFLGGHFCAELRDLAEPGGTRSAQDPNVEELPPELMEIELIQEAYRADPRKTLDLIKRIKSAGGLQQD